MNKRINQQKGITLIALVITIVVLLILAGVSVSTLIGENGIINKTKEAKIESEISNVKEQARIDISTSEIEKQGEVLTEPELYEILIKYGNIGNNSKGEKVLITNDKKYEIPIKDIYVGETIKVDNNDLFDFDSTTGTILGIKEKYVKEKNGKKCINDDRYFTDRMGVCILKDDIDVLIVPSEINGVKVKKIKNLGVVNVKTIIVEEGIEEFEEFNGRYRDGEEEYVQKLEKAKLPSTLKKMGDGTFSGCEYLKEVNIPEGIESIGFMCFSSCERLKEIKLPESLKELTGNAIVGCNSLVEIRIPKNVEKLEHGLSSGRNLERIEVDKDNKNYCSLDGVLFDKDKKILKIYPNAKKDKMYSVPKAVEKIESIINNKILESIEVDKGNKKFSSLDGVLMNKDKTELIQYPGGRKETTYTIPETVKIIGNHSFFSNKNIKEIRMFDNVETIDTRAFCWCQNLENITLSKNLKTIGWTAFGECNSLKTIEMPEGLNKIDGGAFISCTGLTRIDVPSSVTIIGESAFSGCDNLKLINIKKPSGSIKNQSEWGIDEKIIEWNDN